MPKLLVIADDLTGALDAGAQFANERIATHVAIEPACDFKELFQQFDVVAANSETRHSAPEHAAETVRDVVKRGRLAGVDYFYKKTDSTLRGNIGAELDALRLTVGNGRLVFVPASPRLGRMTINGMQLVWGRPLHESQYARDPRSPVRESFIPAIIAKQAKARTVAVTRDQWQKAGKSFFQPEAIFVCDAKTDEDLQNLAARLHELDLLRAIAAPAALAACLSKWIEFPRAAQIARRLTGQILVVIGSVNDVSLKQAERAQKEFDSFWVPAATLLDSKGVDEHLVNRICTSIARGRSVLLQTARNPNDVLSVDDAADYDRLCLQLARLTNQILVRTPVEVLTVFGGDTLLAIARERNWRGMLPQGDIQPGIMLAEPVGDACLKHVLSKPGGFGAEDTLLNVAGTARKQLTALPRG